MGGNGNGFMGMGGNGNRNSPSRTPLLLGLHTCNSDIDTEMRYAGAKSRGHVL